jgi:hypothetical protein
MSIGHDSTSVNKTPLKMGGSSTGLVVQAHSLGSGPHSKSSTVK